MAIKKIKLPGMAQPVDIGATWANISGKPDLVTSDSLTAAINAAFATNDAMVFKGTIGAGGTVTQLPATHEAGWTYKVISNGSLAGQTCEIGDMIVCIADGTVADASDWTVIQTNVDGAVTGPASSIAEHIATFTGTTGKVIKDSGFTIATSVPANAVFTDTTYENKTAASGGTDISLVTTGDKYKWNNDIIISNTQPTSVENKLWINTSNENNDSYNIPTVAESLALGITGANIGNVPIVASVNANGEPTSYIAGTNGGTPYNSNPTMNGTASSGVSNDYARGDHVHPIDTSRQAKITASGILKGNGNGDVSAATAGTDYATPAQVNAKYTKPSGGIPDSDIASAATWNAKATKPTKNSISLSTTWSGSGPYTQTITISGYTLTANSKVDLQPDASVIEQLITDGVQGLFVTNDNGTLTITAIGAAPSAALNIQCTITEVSI